MSNDPKAQETKSRSQAKHDAILDIRDALVDLASPHQIDGTVRFGGAWAHVRVGVKHTDWQRTEESIGVPIPVPIDEHGNCTLIDPVVDDDGDVASVDVSRLLAYLDNPAQQMAEHLVQRVKSTHTHLVEQIGEYDDRNGGDDTVPADVIDRVAQDRGVGGGDGDDFEVVRSSRVPKPPGRNAGASATDARPTGGVRLMPFLRATARVVGDRYAFHIDTVKREGEYLQFSGPTGKGAHWHTYLDRPDFVEFADEHLGAWRPQEGTTELAGDHVVVLECVDDDVYNTSRDNLGMRYVMSMTLDDWNNAASGNPKA